jgi:hypothetical protein
LHVDNYSDDEIEASWYDHFELKLIRRKIRFANRLEQDSESCCRRGAEGLVHVARNVAVQRRKNRSAALEAVLDEQELQWEEGICDPGYIATAYKEANASSQASARAIALINQLDAMT